MCVCVGVTAQEAQKNTRSEKPSKLFLGGGVGVFLFPFGNCLIGFFGCLFFLIFIFKNFLRERERERGLEREGKCVSVLNIMKLS